MATKTREQIQAQIDKLKARQRQLDAREAKAERARDTRQKIVIGGWVKANRPDVWAEAVGSLVRPADKAAFSSESAPPSTAEKKGVSDGKLAA